MILTTETVYDEAIEVLAKYTIENNPVSEEALETARYCLADTLGCGILALQFPQCTKLLGPVVEGTHVPNGVPVPGTKYKLDPIRAAFNIGTMIRWLDFNDTWLAAEWGHPSDNLGGLLAICDYLDRSGKQEFRVLDLLKAMVKAHEIQGGLALQNSFNRIGFDHVILVKVATCAVVASLLGGDFEDICAAISNAWIDTGPLRTYRHAPNTGSRKSWAAGDATSRGTQLAWMVKQGEMGYESALSADKWGVYDVIFKQKPFVFERPLENYVMENILFKISFPAEFHAQTAVEAAITLHKKLKGDLENIQEVKIYTHESAIRIIDKKGPLNNPADRDHCLQYMVAIGLIHGHLKAEHYEDDCAQDPRINAIRNKMVVTEEPRYTQDYLDPNKRSIANALQIIFKDGSKSQLIEVEYPVGHRRRRKEGIPLLMKKFENNLGRHYTNNVVGEFIDLFQSPDRLLSMRVAEFSDLWIK